MAGRRIGDGKSYKAIVPISTTVVGGNFDDFDGVIGMAMEDVTTTASATGLVAVEVDRAHYETNQIDAAQAYGVGAKLYFDDAANVFTPVRVRAAGPPEVLNVFIGVVTAAKDANNVIQFLRLSTNPVGA